MDKELTSSLLEQLILDFDIINSTPADARNFIAWLQVELKIERIVNKRIPVPADVFSAVF